VPSVASAPAPPAPTVAPASDEPTPVAPLPPLPRSLRGTTVAGALPVDADGHLVVAGAVLELFDWFLAASGEEPLAVIRARIEAEIDARLGPPADAEARDLLDRYLAYRDAVEQMALAMGHELPLDRRFQLLRELRREHFGPDARALFGAVEERLRIELAQHRVSEDPTLSEAERAERLAALDAELPAEVRETRDAVLVASRLRAAERSLRETGAGEGEIDALRERMVGPEAAARLAALDARRADFEARLAAYRRERAQLDARAFDDAAAYADALEALRAAHFDGPERRRVDALDRLAEGDGAAVPRTPGS
jgi:lipase chaperone LimK